MRKLCAAAVAALALLPAAGCGGPADSVSKQDAVELAATRSNLDDALDTEETLRTSKQEARRLRARVRKVIGQGSFEGNGKPDEFGLAALGELRDIVPSLVLEQNGSVQALDRQATAAFLRYAVSDPRRAMFGPADDAVTRMIRAAGHDDYGPDTKVRLSSGSASGRTTVGAFLRAAEGDVRPIWPQLGRRLAKARADL